MSTRNNNIPVSKYHGLSWKQQGQQWAVVVCTNAKKYNVGKFNNEQEAAANHYQQQKQPQHDDPLDHNNDDDNEDDNVHNAVGNKIMVRNLRNFLLLWQKAKDDYTKHQGKLVLGKSDASDSHHNLLHLTDN